jgi:repressor LexA
MLPVLSNTVSIEPIAEIQAVAADICERGIAMSEKKPLRKKSEILSARQIEILQAINKLQAERGYMPSMREIGEEVGLTSSASVSYQLKQLEEAGYLTRDENLSRSIDIKIQVPGIEADSVQDIDNVTPIGDGILVPLVGRIAAGIPITADQNIDEYYPLPRQITGKGDLFMLTVVGESMIDAAICDGDLVVVRSQRTAENGDIVAAMLDGEATVKVFQQRDGHTWLLPRNSAFAPILGDHCEIMGKVVSVLRKV